MLSGRGEQYVPGSTMASAMASDSPSPPPLPTPPPPPPAAASLDPLARCLPSGGGFPLVAYTDSTLCGPHSVTSLLPSTRPTRASK
jgi:hypothetical protein